MSVQIWNNIGPTAKVTSIVFCLVGEELQPAKHSLLNTT